MSDSNSKTRAARAKKLPRKPPRKKTPAPQQKRPHGRPRRPFTPEIRAKVLEAAAYTRTMANLALVAGVSVDTFLRWRDDNPVFAADLEKAFRRRAMRIIDGWATAAEKDWRAGYAWLRLHFPDEYIPRDDDGSGAPPIAPGEADTAALEAARAARGSDAAQRAVDALLVALDAARAAGNGAVGRPADDAEPEEAAPRRKPARKA